MLGTPPAFVLSQDQTLVLYSWCSSLRLAFRCCFTFVCLFLISLELSKVSYAVLLSMFVAVVWDSLYSISFLYWLVKNFFKIFFLNLLSSLVSLNRLSCFRRYVKNFFLVFKLSFYLFFSVKFDSFVSLSQLHVVVNWFFSLIFQFIFACLFFKAELLYYCSVLIRLCQSPF